MARFSVVVPAYNAAATLADTLDAVLSQDFGDWECVVVDDGSTDETLSIAQAFAARDQRFRVVSQDNRGSAGAYNTGVREASGEFIVLCSADDILLPEHLAAVAALVDSKPEYDIYSCNGYYLHGGGRRELVYLPGEISESMTLDAVILNCFYSVGAAYRRQWFDAVGGYRSGVFGEDYDFWLRAMASGARHRYLDAPLSLHRISETQKSADTTAAFESDIRILTDLDESFSLTDEQRAAVATAIEVRRKRIAQRASRRTFRETGARAAIVVLGRARLRRLLNGVRRALGRTS